ncbi:MAG TPA: glycosyltransferase [Opitutaceae bacterium]|nr:glycosyltransferase [Opitutaceae bacterium]
MKVLHVLHSPRAEGTVKLALDWLAQPGLVQEVLVLNPNPAEMADELRRRAAWFHQGEKFPAGLKKFSWMLGTTWTICRRRRPDLVVCWTNGFSPWVLGGAWLAGVPRLITHAGNPPTRSVAGKTCTVVSTFVAWITGGRMLCCSRYVASQFACSPGAFASVLRVAYNCAPVGSIREEAAVARAQRADWRPRLIMVGTLEAHKDHATLIKAMPAVVRAVPNVQLWLVGEGSLRRPLENACAELNLTAVVTFLGSRRDVPSLLGQSDVFVFSTTREEGLGTVLIEALAAGLPVVASDVPACAEALEGGRWGRLVPPGDSAALAAALIAHLQAKETETDACSGYLERFSPPCMIASYVAATS